MNYTQKTKEAKTQSSACVDRTENEHEAQTSY